MKSMVRTLSFFFFALTPCFALAQFYQCKDATGRTILSDRPIPECANRVVRELSTNGMLKREIPRPLTAEEKQQKKAEEEKQKAELQAVEAQRKSDRLIVERFGSEKGIEAARKRALDLAQELIKRESAAVAVAEKQLAQAQAAMTQYRAKPASAPSDLRSKIDEAKQIIKEGGKIIQTREAEIVEVNAKYDEIIKRYREVTETAEIK